MPIYEDNTKNKKTYTVVVNAKIKGKQYYKKRRGITSMHRAKRVETELRLMIEQYRQYPKRFIFKTWVERCIDQMSLQFKKSTIIGYKSNLNKWAIPVFGELFLDEITSSMIHDLIFNHIKGVSLHARNGVLKNLKRIFEMAIDEGVLNKNPAKIIKIKLPDAKNAVLNKTEIDTLLTKANEANHNYYHHWVLALMTGMRKGELHALTWMDIDFENKVIAVTKSWNPKDGLGPTKSTKNRYIPISNELHKFLIKLKSDSFNENQKVLEDTKGWNTGDQSIVLKTFCKEIGITPIRFHDLRATFITQLLLRGVSLAKVMKIVGHASIKTTMGYLRLVAQDTQGATEELGITLPSKERLDNVVNLFDK
ncbi:MAG: hypothetical protein CME62_12050 [Halobacteriovoraceae bacterium]|nr:hypothetical protein [Halobacteriovoraceae bacterium]|tara:strand:- start:41780 stop:42877 length:1098 start_codon:yes stop_codon:yes gene_type:complete